MTTEPITYTDEQREADTKARRTIARHLHEIAAFAASNDWTLPDTTKQPRASTLVWAANLRDILADKNTELTAERLLQWLIAPSHMVKPGENGTLTKWLMARALVPTVSRDDLPAFLAHASAWQGGRDVILDAAEQRIASLEADLEMERRGVRAEQLANEELRREVERHREAYEAKLTEARRALEASELERQRMAAVAAELDEVHAPHDFVATDPVVSIGVEATRSGLVVSMRDAKGWSWIGDPSALRTVIQREQELTKLGQAIGQSEAGLKNIDTKRRQVVADLADLRADMVELCRVRTATTAEDPDWSQP